MQNFSEGAANPEEGKYICTLCYLSHSPPANGIPDTPPTQNEIILNTMRQDNPRSLVTTDASSSETEIMRRRSNHNRDDVSSSYYPHETQSIPSNKFYDHRSTIDDMGQASTGGRVDHAQSHVSYAIGGNGALDPFRERYNSFSNNNCNAACTSLPRINSLSKPTFDFNHNDADTACASSTYLPTILFSPKATSAEQQAKCSSAESSERKHKCDSFGESSLSLKRAVRNDAAEGVSKVNAIKLPGGHFKCHVCSKLFSKTYTLKQHIDIAHSGNRLYRCDTCGKRFKTEDEKEVHSALHMTTDKKHKCSECTREYHQRSELNRHIKEKHSEKPLGCHLCQRRYYRKDQFNKHILTHFNPKRRGRPPLNMDPGVEKLPP